LRKRLNLQSNLKNFNTLALMISFLEKDLDPFFNKFLLHLTKAFNGFICDLQKRVEVLKEVISVMSISHFLLKSSLFVTCVDGKSKAQSTAFTQIQISKKLKSEMCQEVKVFIMIAFDSKDRMHHRRSKLIHNQRILHQANY